jgi:hypothetical protein
VIVRERLFVAVALFFLVAWMASEWEERRNRGTWQDRLEDFMEAKGPNAGNRFTAEDGEALRQRIEEVADQCEARCDNEQE